MASKTPINFLNRDSTSITIQVNESTETYEILRALEFTSERKCMTLIVKRNDGKLFAFAKGADTSIFPKIDQQG